MVALLLVKLLEARSSTGSSFFGMRSRHHWLAVLLGREGKSILLLECYIGEGCDCVPDVNCPE